MPTQYNEWILTNEKGSFAIGAKDRLPRRKYHSLLTQRTPLKGEPLNWLLETLETVNGQALLDLNFGSADTASNNPPLKDFSWQNGLVWKYQVGSIQIVRRLTIHPELDTIKVDYEFTGVNDTATTFEIRPLMLVRPWHKLTLENIVFHGALQQNEDNWSLEPYEGLGTFYFRTKETQLVEMKQQGHWYKNLYYQTEEDRGYPCREDVFVPGAWIFKFDSDQKISFYMGLEANPITKIPKVKKKLNAPLRPNYLNDLNQAAEAYLVKNRDGFMSIIAGYPWFEAWSRDTMLALPGLMLETNQLEAANQLLMHWKDFFFVDTSRQNTTKEVLNLSGLDSPLLFIRALRLLGLKLVESKNKKQFFKQFQPGLSKLITAYIKDEIQWVKIKTEGFWVNSGPFASGWMDAVIDGVPVTPRHGFAVDLCALWIESLSFAIELEEALPAQERTPELKEWKALLVQNRTNFKELFWDEEAGYLADVHNGLTKDMSLRPNQLWALAIPEPLLTKAEGERLLQKVEAELLTPRGLRTLSPHDSHYIGKYVGSQNHRDLAYHQGTVWPWLLGIYCDAVVAVRGTSQLNKLAPLLEGMKTHFYEEACVGQISEIFDGDAPWTPRGTPVQAWSVSEILRIETLIENTIRRTEMNSNTSPNFKKSYDNFQSK